MAAETGNTSPLTDEGLEACEALLGHRFGQREFLQRALTHASAKEAARPSNERLEFLGDAVLGLVISDQLFCACPDFAEGDLTQARSAVVSARTLAAKVQTLGLARFLHIGKGLAVRSPIPASVLADLFEACVGAIYLDAGLEAARGFILDQLKDELERAVGRRSSQNYKSLLQQLSQRQWTETPVYQIVSAAGPDHKKTFEVVAKLGERVLARGTGLSKKEAEQRAAAASLELLQAELGLGLAPGAAPQQ